jgi:hypothetical protein
LSVAVAVPETQCEPDCQPVSEPQCKTESITVAEPKCQAESIIVADRCAQSQPNSLYSKGLQSVAESEPVAKCEAERVPESQPVAERSA